MEACRAHRLQGRRVRPGTGQGELPLQQRGGPRRPDRQRRAGLRGNRAARGDRRDAAGSARPRPRGPAAPARLRAESGSGRRVRTPAVRRSGRGRGAGTGRRVGVPPGALGERRRRERVLGRGEGGQPAQGVQEAAEPHRVLRLAAESGAQPAQLGPHRLRPGRVGQLAVGVQHAGDPPGAAAQQRVRHGLVVAAHAEPAQERGRLRAQIGRQRLARAPAVGPRADAHRAAPRVNAVARSTGDLLCEQVAMLLLTGHAGASGRR